MKGVVELELQLLYLLEGACVIPSCTFYDEKSEFELDSLRKNHFSFHFLFFAFEVKRIRFFKKS